MENSRTPYGCGICEKMFHSSNFLIKHAELRHPSSVRHSSIFSSTISGTTKTNSSSDNQQSLLQKKSNRDVNPLEFVVMNGIEIDKNSTDIGIQDESTLSESSTISDNQTDTATSKDEVINIEIRYFCMICEKHFLKKQAWMNMKRFTMTIILELVL